MTERTELLKLRTLSFGGPNGEPSSHSSGRIVARPAWATALIYGTMTKSLCWVDKPITRAVEYDIQSVDALTGLERAVRYSGNAGWRNVWIQPEVVEAPARLAVFYACIIEDGDKPHENLDEAMASAERHAKAKPGTRVTVMQAHGAVTATTELNWS